MPQYKSKSSFKESSKEHVKFYKKKNYDGIKDMDPFTILNKSQVEKRFIDWAIKNGYKNHMVPLILSEKYRGEKQYSFSEFENLSQDEFEKGAIHLYMPYKKYKGLVDFYNERLQNPMKWENKEREKYKIWDPNKILIYRDIANTMIDELNLDKIGNSWSWNKEDANVWIKYDIAGDYSIYTFTAMVDRNDIDWEETIFRNILFPSEKEIFIPSSKDKEENVIILNIQTREGKEYFELSKAEREWLELPFGSNTN